MGVKRAFAVGYDPGEEAPRVLARGAGAVAARIVDLARERGVPVREDAALAAALGSLEAGCYVPPELYEAFAVILAELWRAERVLERDGSQR